MDSGHYLFITAPGFDLEVEIQPPNFGGDGLLRAEESGPPSVGLKLGQSRSRVIGSGLDNANGVSYIIDTLLIPEETREALETARALWRADEALQQHILASPDYIQETNLHHWYYGRLGGTPQYRSDQIPDVKQHPNPKQPRRGVIESIEVKVHIW